ncbi:MAG: HEPN domain-containing protein [Promethearchaeota archaeon]|nr:MAG: HEPN domain-containing protein [Candidatus Lokiarchaeota archaeon]
MGEEKLRSAQILLENNQYEDSISRSYYAAYLSIRALLFLLGSSPKTHTRTLTMLSLKVIKEGIISEQIGKDFGQLLEARQNSDYSIFTYYNLKDAKGKISPTNIIEVL